ncbi:tail protein X [Burkholderia territorii]|uniref:tail protein X n=1 Tax=Burkholderia territorii TaxID=1503055 RepID=UPI000A7239FB|nr:tail protein X [Burkholderia territorii]
MKVAALQGETLDALCWRYYASTAGTVEAVLEANPGLAELGVVLPMGSAQRWPLAHSRVCHARRTSTAHPDDLAVLS